MTEFKRILEILFMEGYLVNSHREKPKKEFILQKDNVQIDVTEL